MSTTEASARGARPGEIIASYALKIIEEGRDIDRPRVWTRTLGPPGSPARVAAEQKSRTKSATCAASVCEVLKMAGVPDLPEDPKGYANTYVPGLLAAMTKAGYVPVQSSKDLEPGDFLSVYSDSSASGYHIVTVVDTLRDGVKVLSEPGKEGPPELKMYTWEQLDSPERAPAKFRTAYRVPPDMVTSPPAKLKMEQLSASGTARTDSALYKNPEPPDLPGIAALDRWRELSGSLLQGDSPDDYVNAGYDALTQMKDDLTPEEEKQIRDEGSRIWAWAQGPEEAATHIVDRAIENYPKHADAIRKNRPALEEVARLTNDYFHAAAGRDELAKTLLDEGSAPDFTSAQKIVTDGLNVAREKIQEKRDAIPISRKKQSDIGYYSGRSREAESLFPVPPAPNDAPEGFFASMGGAFARGFVEEVALGSEEWKGRAALGAPAGRAAKRIGPWNFDVIPANPQAVMEDIGRALAWAPTIPVAGGASRVAGKVAGPAIKAAGRLGPLLSGAIHGGAGGFAAGVANPSQAPTDVQGRLQMGALVGAGGTFLGGGLMAGKQAIGAGIEANAKRQAGKLIGKADMEPRNLELLAERGIPEAKRTPVTASQKAQIEAQMKAPVEAPPAKPVVAQTVSPSQAISDQLIRDFRGGATAGTWTTPDGKTYGLAIKKTGKAGEYEIRWGEPNRPIEEWHRWGGGERGSGGRLFPESRVPDQIRGLVNASFPETAPPTPATKLPAVAAESTGSPAAPEKLPAVPERLPAEAPPGGTPPPGEPPPGKLPSVPPEKRGMTIEADPHTLAIEDARRAVDWMWRGTVRGARAETNQAMLEMERMKKELFGKVIYREPGETALSKGVWREGQGPKESRLPATSKWKAGRSGKQLEVPLEPGEPVTPTKPGPLRADKGRVAEDLGAILEENPTGNIKFPNDTPAAARDRLKRGGHDSFVPRMRKLFDDQWRRMNAFARENIGTEGDFIDYISDYLPHFYHTGPKQTLDKAIRYWMKGKTAPKFKSGKIVFGPSVPASQPRTFKTLADAMAADLGLIPKTQDAFKLYELYADINWRNLHMRKFTSELGRMKIRHESGTVVPAVTTYQMQRRIIDSPYKRVDSRFFKDGSAWVHEEIAPIVRMMSQRPWSNKFMRGMDAINSWTKFSNISLSGFHHVALSESFMAASRDFMFNPVRALVTFGGRSAKTGKRRWVNAPIREGYQLSKDPAARRIMDEAGLGLGHYRPDVGVGHVMHSLEWMDQILSNGVARGAETIRMGSLARPAQMVATAPIKVAKKFVDANNFALWDMIHNGYKSYTFFQWRYHFNKQLLEKNVVNPKTGRPWAGREIDDEISSVLNNAFGGQEWETQYWAKPEVQRWLRISSFSLDWTTSNMKIAGTPFSKNPIRQQMGHRYWRNMISTLFGFQGGLQYGIYKMWGDPEQGDTPYFWKNGAENVGSIDVTPFYRSRGLWEQGDRRIYVGLGKQAKELVRWNENPFYEAFVKESPVAHDLVDLFVGVGGIVWGDRNASRPMFDRVVRYRDTFVERRLPFSMGGKKSLSLMDPKSTQFMLSIPQRRGPSHSASVKQMNHKLRRYVDPILPWYTPSYQEDLLRDMDKIIEEGRNNGTIKSDKDARDMLQQAIDGNDFVIGVRQDLMKDIYEAWEDSKRDENGVLADPKAEKLITDRLFKIMLLQRNAGLVARNLIMSGGISTPEEEQKFFDLLERAEQRLYELQMQSEQEQGARRPGHLRPTLEPSDKAPVVRFPQQEQ